MVAPNPLLRVPPSGPLADSNDGTLTPPLDGIAGYLFHVSDYDEEAVLPEGLGDESTSGVIIGPSDSSNPTYGVFYRAGHTKITSGGVTSTTHADTFSPDDDGAAAFEFTEGVWLVEAELSAGYNTAGPTALTDGGAVAANIYLVNDTTGAILNFDGSNDKLSLAQPFVAAASHPGANTVLVRGLINVTKAILDLNGGPISSFALVMQRYTLAGSSLGAYSSASGWLAFNRESNLVIRRYA